MIRTTDVPAILCHAAGFLERGQGERELAGMRAAFSFEKGKAWPNRRGAPLARSRCAQGA